MKNEILENGENNDAGSNFPGRIKDEPLDEDAKESNVSKSDGGKISNRLGFNERYLICVILHTYSYAS